MKRILALVVLMALIPTGALARDKMDRVDILRDGGSGSAVVARWGAQGYKLDSAGTYDFSLLVYAAARKGFRIANAWMFSGPPLQATYEQSLSQQEYGSGMRRAVRRSHLFSVPLQKVHWNGRSPAEVCNDNLSMLKSAGLREDEIILMTHRLTAVAIVGFGAAADREGLTATSVGLSVDSTYMNKTLNYQVHVECRP